MEYTKYSEHRNNYKKYKKQEITLVKQRGGIRCYSKTGFFAPITQPDGRVVQKFFYGREGD